MSQEVMVKYSNAHQLTGAWG